MYLYNEWWHKQKYSEIHISKNGVGVEITVKVTTNLTYWLRYCWYTYGPNEETTHQASKCAKFHENACIRSGHLSIANTLSFGSTATTCSKRHFPKKHVNCAFLLSMPRRGTFEYQFSAFPGARFIWRFVIHRAFGLSNEKLFFTTISQQLKSAS